MAYFSLFPNQSTEPQVTDPFHTMHQHFGTICELKLEELKNSPVLKVQLKNYCSVKHTITFW